MQEDREEGQEHVCTKRTTAWGYPEVRSAAKCGRRSEVHRCPRAEHAGVARASASSLRPSVAASGGLGCERICTGGRARGEGGATAGPDRTGAPLSGPALSGRRATEAGGVPRPWPRTPPSPERAAGVPRYYGAQEPSHGRAPQLRAQKSFPDPGPEATTESGGRRLEHQPVLGEPPAGWVGGKHKTNEPWPKWRRPDSLCVNSGFTTLNPHISKLMSGQTVK